MEKPTVNDCSQIAKERDELKKELSEFKEFIQAEGGEKVRRLKYAQTHVGYAKTDKYEN